MSETYRCLCCERQYRTKPEAKSYLATWSPLDPHVGRICRRCHDQMFEYKIHYIEYMHLLIKRHSHLEEEPFVNDLELLEDEI